MTPQDLMAGLRDLHLPEAEAATASDSLVLWPLALVLLAAIVAAFIIWRRRSVWRRDFFVALDQIEQDVDQGVESESWARLAFLLKRFALQRQGRHDVAALSGGQWLKRLDDLTGTDLFTNGPGRGIASFPYLAHDRDDEAAGQRRDDLKATIQSLRHRVSRSGPWR